MSADKEWQRLCELYAEKSDGELVALYAEREDLTEIAQQALQDVMHGRHLDPASVDGDATTEPAETDSELLPGEMLLWGFRDGSDASRASAYLKDAGIAHRFLAVEDFDQDGQRSRRMDALRLAVRQQDAGSAERVLRDTVGLFPLPEAGFGAQLELLSDLTLLVMFQREFEFEKALGLARTLANNGVSFLWRDGGDASASLPDMDFVAIEVREPSLGKAQGLLEQFVATLPEDELSGG